LTNTKSQAGQGFSQEDWDDVSDNPEWTAEDVVKAKPFAEVFPELAATIRRRGKQTAPTKEMVSIRVRREVLEKFRALGPGWQKRMNAVLEEAAKAL
jgi:uncharacterized protein (DUF4415 family)